MKTVSDVTNITLLVLIFVICYLLIGMELFAFKLPIEPNKKFFHPDYYHHSTYNTFLDAFLSVFIVLANDGWTKIYIDHYRATDSIISSVYFLSLIVIGQFVLMNLFISILIENFEQISVRNDIVKRLTDLKQGSSYEKIK